MSTIPGVVIPDQFNAATAFLDRNLAEGRGPKTAVYFEGNAYTYAQIAELANRVGNALLDLGVDMEQRVALLLLDSPQFAAGFFGAIKIGAVPVPLNTTLRPNDYVYMLNDSRARVLLIHSVVWSQIQQILPELKYVRHIVVVGLEQDGTKDTATLHDFEKWTQKASAELQAAATTKDDSAFWLYSSGSTGFPKGCVHLQHDMTYCTEFYAKPILGIREEDITFSAAKLFFAYGLGNNLYFPSVRICVSAGEALPADILRRWKEKFNVDILDGIGSTEILHIFISNRIGQIKPGSSGKLVPGYEALITDESGHAVKQGEIGNLLIRGDSTAAYYWNKHEKTKDVINGHWIHTGDKYYEDDEGFLWYCGRSDDMLKVGGQWVSPVEVEGALIAHPSVLEAAVVGAMDADELVKPKAYIVLNQGYEPSEAMANELKTFVKGRLASFEYQRWIEFVPELPKTATGKIQRFKLRSNTGL